jgi:hypothetical protein
MNKRHCDRWYAKRAFQRVWQGKSRARRADTRASPVAPLGSRLSGDCNGGSAVVVPRAQRWAARRAQFNPREPPGRVLPPRAYVGPRERRRGGVVAGADPVEIENRSAGAHTLCVRGVVLAHFLKIQKAGWEGSRVGCVSCARSAGSQGNRLGTLSAWSASRHRSGSPLPGDNEAANGTAAIPAPPPQLTYCVNLPSSYGCQFARSAEGNSRATMPRRRLAVQDFPAARFRCKGG